MSREPRTGSVRIKLDGLMLSRYGKVQKDSSPVFEVGVLKAEGHKFSICWEVVDSQNNLIDFEIVRLPRERGRWRLCIEGRDTDVELFKHDFDFDRKHLSENPDLISSDSRKRMDFRWVLDLEGKEFGEHPPTLELNPGHLSPIFEFPNGLVFNELLSPMVTRSIGGGPPEPFGKVSDVVGVDIDASPDDFLVLLDEEGGDIFRIRVEADRQVFVFINNIPPRVKGDDQALVSHFHMYYDAFKGVDTKYDIQPVDKGDRHPHHPHGPDPQEGHPNESGHPLHAAPIPAAAIGERRPRAEEEIIGCGGGDFGGGGAPMCGKCFLGNRKQPLS